MTRIIGGVARGRRLATPRGTTTRPTSDRVREALFSSVEAWAGSLAGLRFLDLYAGSGAVGLEALSRGAAAVLLVESDRRTAQLIQQNLKDLDLAGAEVISSTVATALARGTSAPFDVVFLDPPYPLENAAVQGDLALLVGHGWVADDALVVVERAARGEEFTWPEGFEEWRTKEYGETVLRYGHAAPSDAADETTPPTGGIVEE